MKRRYPSSLRALAFLGALLVALIAVMAGLSREACAEGNGSDAARCIQVRAEARYRALGYDHVVHIANACAAPADCVVSTDVNPDPQRVIVPGGAQIETLTFMGSPARVFVPRVTCTMRR